MKDLFKTVSKELFGMEVDYEWAKTQWNAIFEYSLYHSANDTIKHFGNAIIEIMKNSYLDYVIDCTVCEEEEK